MTPAAIQALTDLGIRTDDASCAILELVDLVVRRSEQRDLMREQRDENLAALQAAEKEIAARAHRERALTDRIESIAIDAYRAGFRAGREATP